MYASMIAALAEVWSKFLDLCKVKVENQSESEVIKDKKVSNEANKDALKALKIADKYKDEMSMKDQFLFRHFYSEFLNDK